MENLLAVISKKIIHILNNSDNRTELELLQMQYGVQILLYNSTVLLLLLSLSQVLHLFTESFFILLTFAALRTIAGGYHFNSMLKCVIATTLIIIGGSKCAQQIHISLPVCIIISIVIIILLFCHKPRGTENNPFTPEYALVQKKRLRAAALFFPILAILYPDVLREPIIIAMSLATISLIPTWFHKSPEPV